MAEKIDRQITHPSPSDLGVAGRETLKGVIDSFGVASADLIDGEHDILEPHALRRV